MRVLRQATALALAALALPLAAQEAEPTLPTILERHRSALGGDRLAEVESVELTGTFVALSEEGTFRLRRQRPGSYRLDYRMLGESLSEIYDGKSAWTIHPHMGLSWPTPMSTPERAAVVGDADFLGPLVDTAAKGHELELVGRSDFDGLPVWEIRVARADGGEETWMLDTETYLPVSRISPTTDWGVPHERTTFFDDWRAVDGVQIPFYMEGEFFIRHQIFQVEDAAINGEGFGNPFEPPVPEPLTALAPLAGSWSVTVESRPAPSPQAPWSKSAGRAEITAEAGGKLLVERLELTAQGRPATAFRTWSYDTGESAYRLTHFDDIGGKTEVFVGDAGNGDEGAAGEDDDPAWVLTDRTSNEPPPPSTPAQRWRVRDVTDDGFVMEQEISLDQGETWLAMLRLRYGNE